MSPDRITCAPLTQEWAGSSGVTTTRRPEGLRLEVVDRGPPQLERGLVEGERAWAARLRDCLAHHPEVE